MTMTHELKIINLARESNMAGLDDEKHNLQILRMKMDRFFSLFLDKFAKKMNPDTPDTKIWKLYKEKLKEYHELERCIKLADYYLKKGTV